MQIGTHFNQILQKFSVLCWKIKITLFQLTKASKTGAEAIQTAGNRWSDYLSVRQFEFFVKRTVLSKEILLMVVFSIVKDSELQNFSYNRRFKLIRVLLDPLIYVCELIFTVVNYSWSILRFVLDSWVVRFKENVQ